MRIKYHSQDLHITGRTVAQPAKTANDAVPPGNQEPGESFRSAAADPLNLLRPPAGGSSQPTLTNYAEYLAAVDRLDLANITAPKDPILRNQWVTQGYWELSKGMDSVINPPGSPDGGVNWSAHATWASRQAGEGIKGEGLPPAGVDHVPGELSFGNSLVFKDVGPDLQSFVQEFQSDEQPDFAQFDKWAQRFPESMQGKKEAFTAYYKARFEEDPKKKQELVLLGNVKLVGYEQKTLQEVLNRAMTAGGLSGKLAHFAANALMGPGGSNIFDDIARRAGTRGVLGLKGMELSYPVAQGEMQYAKLAEDVPNLPSKNLSTISNYDLRKTFESLNLSPDLADGGGSGAKNWSVYGDRMRYISQHFRANHMNKEMLKCDPQPNLEAPLPATGGTFVDPSTAPKPKGLLKLVPLGRVEVESRINHNPTTVREYMSDLRNCDEHTPGLSDTEYTPRTATEGNYQTTMAFAGLDYRADMEYRKTDNGVDFEGNWKLLQLPKFPSFYEEVSIQVKEHPDGGSLLNIKEDYQFPQFLKPTFPLVRYALKRILKKQHKDLDWLLAQKAQGA